MTLGDFINQMIPVALKHFKTNKLRIIIKNPKAIGATPSV